MKDSERRRVWWQPRRDRTADHARSDGGVPATPAKTTRSNPGMVIVALLGVAMSCAGLAGAWLLFQELGGLIGGDAGVVVVSHCERNKWEWDCSGRFRAADGTYTIDDVSIYIDDARAAQPGGQVQARVFGPAADSAVTPGNWENVVPYLIMTVGVGGAGVAGLKRWWSSRDGT